MVIHATFIVLCSRQDHDCFGDSVHLHLQSVDHPYKPSLIHSIFLSYALIIFIARNPAAFLLRTLCSNLKSILKHMFSRVKFEIPEEKQLFLKFLKSKRPCVGKAKTTSYQSAQQLNLS